MCTEGIKYKKVCGFSANGNFIYPYQNIVVKEVEPYSFSLCPEDFSTQNQMDVRKKPLRTRGIWVSRSALQEESPAQRGKSCPSASWAQKAVAGRDSPLWSPLGTSLPLIQPGCIHPEHWHCLQPHSTAKQRAFFCKRPLAWKKEGGREQLQQVRAESRGVERILGLFQVLT